MSVGSQLVSMSVALYVLSSLVTLTRAFVLHNAEEENEVMKADKLPVDLPPTSLEATYYTLYAGKPVAAGSRRKEATFTDTCGQVRGVPKELRDAHSMALDLYYVKYTEAYGIPVVGGAEVTDRALQRACYVLRFMLADRVDVRQRYYKRYGRVAVIGRDVALTSLPEYRHLPLYFNALRGLGAIATAPVTSVGEENVLCDEVGDSSRHEDVLVRELAEGLLHLALPAADPSFLADLRLAHDQASRNGWWRRTYAAISPAAYFAEGVQSYFNVNAYADPPNGQHNSVNLRVKPRSYDPELYHLVHEVFPCANNFIKRCHNRGNEEYQLLLTNCPPTSWSSRRRSERRTYRTLISR